MTASLLATAAVGAFAETDFSDVPEDHPFATEIGWLVENEITTGFPDDTFRPTIPVTRMAGVTWLYRWAGSPDVDEPAGFTDLDNVPPEFATAIAWAVDAGITTGYADDTFRPTNAVTRRAFAAWLFRAAGEPEGDFAAAAAAAFDDVTVDTTFANEIGWMVENEITTGWPDGTFRPGNNVTRQAGAAFLYRFDALESEVPILRVVEENVSADTVWISDGVAVTEYEYTGDSFEIDGVPSSIALFEQFLEDKVPQVLIESRVEGEDVIHNVTEDGLTLAGTLSVVGTLPHAIVDAPSGVTLTEVTEQIVGATRNFFTVDGVSVTAAVFLNNLSSGDFIEVEVVEAGEEPDFSDFIFRHNLTNQTLTGVALDTASWPIAVDPNADDDADLTEFDLFRVAADEGTTNVYIIDGEDNEDGTPFTEADFIAAVEEGFEVSFSVVAGVGTYEVTTVPTLLDPVTGILVGGTADGDDVDLSEPITLLVDVAAGTTATATLATDSAVTIDGVASTFDELEETLSFGDVVTYQPEDDENDPTVVVTSGTVSGLRVVAKDVDVVSATASLSTITQITVQVGGFLADVVPGDPVLGIGTVGFTVNGEAEIDDVTVDEAFVAIALDATNLVLNTVTVSLVKGATPVWAFDGLPEAAVDEAVSELK